MPIETMVASPKERAEQADTKAARGRGAPWGPRAGRFFRGLVVLHLLCTAIFIGVLVVGESTRLSFLILYAPRQPVLVASVAAALVAYRLRSRVLLALEAVLALVVLGPVMGFAVSAPRHAEQPIKLLSYNIFFGKLGREAVLDEISAAPADIILLQAANDSMGSQLDRRLPGRSTRQDGELVISTRFSIRETTVPARLPDGASAMFVRYVVETPSGPLEVFNVHPYSPREALFDKAQWSEDVARREAQIAGVILAARSAGAPFVIAGDTNLPVMSGIARRQFTGLVDAFDDAGFGFGYTFPSKHPWMRLDRVLSGRGVRFLDVTVGPRGASDHRRLTVDLELVP